MFYSLRSSALALLACAEIARKAYITLVERKALTKQYHSRVAEIARNAYATHRVISHWDYV